MFNRNTLISAAVAFGLLSPAFAQQAAAPAKPASAPAAAASAAAPQSKVQQIPAKPAPAPAPKPMARGAKPPPPPVIPPVTTEIMPLTMFVGEVKTLPYKDLMRVAVGNGKLLSSSVLDDDVLLLAEGAGDTSLYLWQRNGNLIRFKVRIHPVDADDAKTQAETLLAGFPGLKVEKVNDNIVVRGYASKTNLPRVTEALRVLPKVVNLVQEEDVTMKKMVYLKVQILEFKKSALENLGVQWEGSAVGPGLALAGDVISNSQFRFSTGTTPPSFVVGSSGGAASALSIPNQIGKAYFGIATQLASSINLSVNNGDAWILASPELSTRSGGEAKFLAGGQIPLPALSATGMSGVTFKDYGIKLTIKPTADEKGNIQASISTELSDIDPAVTVQGIPGFLMRSTDSEVNVKSGQTIVLSGLMDQKSSKDTTKFPFLGDLPILGALFKSNNFKAGRTDLVIFVTPIITDPTSTTNTQRLEKAKELREKFENEIGNKGIVD